MATTFVSMCCAAILHIGYSSAAQPWWQKQDWDGGLWQSYYYPAIPADSPQVSPVLFPTFLKTIFAPSPLAENEIHSNEVQRSPSFEDETIEHYNITDRVTDYECKSDQDCHKINVTLSCMGATPTSMGVCMLPLKPMEHGCVFNDQCQKTCVESFCAKEHKYKNSKGENQCRCQKGYYYLWKKCWNNCLPGTVPVQNNEDNWICQEKNVTQARKFSTNSQSKFENSSDDNLKPVKTNEEHSLLPEKYELPNEQKILAHSRTEVLAQIETGKTIKVPFRLWQIAIRKCYIPHQAYKDLTVAEREIYSQHMQAVQKRKLTYEDPKTKNQVMTVTALILQDKCCGNACRHCPYEHVNVPEDRRHKKVFNGAFYV